MAPSNIHPCLLLLLVAFFTIAFNHGQAACVTKSTTPSPTSQPPLRSAFRTRKFAASAPAGGQQEAPAQSPFSRTHPMDMSSSPPEACPPEASSPQAFPPDASSPEVSPPETFSSSASLLLDTSAVTSSLSAASMSSNIASSAPQASAPGTPSPEASTPGASAPETSSDTSPTASHDASAPTHPVTSSTSGTSAPGTSALDTPSTGTGGTGIGGDPGLKRICDATDNPQLCLVTISPFLSAGTGKADPMTVLRMAIKACMENARLALSTARTFTVGLHVAGDKGTASSLDTCTENYSDALDNLDSALGAIEANDMGTMNSMLSAVVTDFGSCTDAFAESGASSPLASFDDKLAKMASNSLAIVSLIKQ